MDFGDRQTYDRNHKVFSALPDTYAHAPPLEIGPLGNSTIFPNFISSRLGYLLVREQQYLSKFRLIGLRGGFSSVGRFEKSKINSSSREENNNNNNIFAI